MLQRKDTKTEAHRNLRVRTLNLLHTLGMQVMKVLIELAFLVPGKALQAAGEEREPQSHPALSPRQM